MEDLTTAGNSTVTMSGNPEAGPQTVSNGTGNLNGEASQSATGQESFMPQGVDINTLPPNVRAMVEKINKDMVRGFTEKTSKLSETIKSEVAKSTESYKSKAELYDQIAREEKFVSQWNDYVRQQQEAGTPAQEGDPVLTKLKAQLDEVTQKMQLTELAQVTDAFADAVDEKGQKMHADFDNLNSIVIGQFQNGGKAEEFSLLRACIELAPGNTPQEKLANGYKTASASYGAIFEAGKKAGMGRLQTKMMNGSLPPSNTGSDALSVTDRKPKNAREAIEMAKRGQMVSRD